MSNTFCNYCYQTHAGMGPRSDTLIYTFTSKNQQLDDDLKKQIGKYLQTHLPETNFFNSLASAFLRTRDKSYFSKDYKTILTKLNLPKYECDTWDLYGSKDGPLVVKILVQDYLSPINAYHFFTYYWQPNQGFSYRGYLVKLSPINLDDLISS